MDIPPQPEPQSPPSPVPPPIDDPVIAQGSRRKAILATGLVTVMALAVVWADPLNMFNFGVEFGENQAAEPELSSTPISAQAQGITALCEDNAIVISWNPIAEAQLNGINRSEGNDPYKVHYVEPRETNFVQYSYRDTDIRPGTTYRYQVFTAIPGDSRPAVTITCQ
jgi:hypothetical protein